ncbi:hypothetical protein [Stenotrophomonas pigmentata]|uniref:hypothetical protein n=1 Tax=Stenotrophomonas pigmentata TaxID=3055080 RepID=UPI0026F3370A|nr:hypothetical protein [Stenotrophomonas sp. 610A2]
MLLRLLGCCFGLAVALTGALALAFALAFAFAFALAVALASASDLSLLPLAGEGARRADEGSF